MKVLFISEFFPSQSDINIHGGVEARTYYIGRYLAEKKHQVHVLTSYSKENQRNYSLEGMSVKCVGWPKKYSRAGEIIKRLGFIVAAIRHGLFIDFEIVEGSGFIGWLPALVLKNLKHKKGVVLVADTIRAYTQDLNIFLRILLLAIEKIFLRGNWDKIICISYTVKKKIRELGIHNNLITIYCGADIKYITKLKVEKKYFPSICCVSRLVSYKRLQDLILATSYLKDKYPSIRVHIVGDGEEYAFLKELTQKLGLQKNINFYQFILSHTKVFKLIKSSYIFCLPSIVEGFGMVTIEALATETPVVLADISIHHEITRNQGVLFFTPGEGHDLAEKLNSLLSQPKLYKKLKQQTLQIAQKYDWLIVAKKTELIYANLCTN